MAVPYRCGSGCWVTGLQTLAEHDRSEWIFAHRWDGRDFAGSSICFYGFGLVLVVVGATSALWFERIRPGGACLAAAQNQSEVALLSGIADDPVQEVVLALMSYIPVIQREMFRLVAFEMVSTSANVLVESCLWELA